MCSRAQCRAAAISHQCVPAIPTLATATTRLYGAAVRWPAQHAGSSSALMVISCNKLQMAPAVAASPSQHAPPPDRDTQLMLQRARQLYEEAWSTPRGVLLLEDIMSEDHQQVDQVWQGGSSSSQAGGGRRRMKRGILAYRAAYPDIQFVVQSAAAVPGKDEVFVHWTASGTNTGPIRDQPPSGQRVAFSGITLLRFDEAGQIQQSLVFREAPADEARYFTAQRS